MSSPRCDAGVVGLGVMGGGIARNLASRGYRVAIHSRRRETAAALATAHPEAALEVAGDLDAFVQSLETPRRILLLVPAGAAVDDLLGALGPLLARDDVVVDAGNSHFADTDRRVESAGQSWHFVGMGVSGGAEGALRGPSLMPGGDGSAWPVVRAMCEAIAAPSDRGPCVAWCGSGGAGHFVKMVHNGIEYADLQLLAESALLLRRGLTLSSDAVADVLAAWNEGELASFLVESAARVFRVHDPKNPGVPLLDAVLDRAGQKGTGRWAVLAAFELGIPMPACSAAVAARSVSAHSSSRQGAGAAFGTTVVPLEGVDAEDVRDAFYASRVISYAEGFALLAAAVRERAYGTDLGEVARIWRGGSIIRARVLDSIHDTLARGEQSSLALCDPLRGEVARRLPELRRVVSAAARAGLPVPAFSAALAWIDTSRVSPGPAALIQALRDSFGAHGFERRDRPGEVAHATWQPNRAD